MNALNNLLNILSQNLTPRQFQLRDYFSVSTVSIFANNYGIYCKT